MKVLLFFIILGASDHLYSSAAFKKDSWSCHTKIDHYLKKWGGIKDWKILHHGDGNLNRFTLKKETSRFGHWIFLSKMNRKQELAYTNEVENIVVTFENDCSVKLALTKNEIKSVKDNHFQNKDLFAFLQKNKKDIISMWSPGMNHSAAAMVRLNKVAKDESIEVLHLMDPNGDPREAQAFLKKNSLGDVKITHLDSPDLMLRDATIHYPAFFVINNHKIVSPVLPGLMNELDYKATLKDYVK